MSKSSSEAAGEPERAFCEWRVWTVTVYKLGCKITITGSFTPCLYISWEMTPISIGGEKQVSISGGSQSPIWYSLRQDYRGAQLKYVMQLHDAHLATRMPEHSWIRSATVCGRSISRWLKAEKVRYAEKELSNKRRLLLKIYRFHKSLSIYILLS